MSVTELEGAQLIPLHDRIVVDPDPTEDVTASGIILPTQARQKPDTGTVVAMGPGKLNNFGVLDPMPVEEGDRILFHQHAGVELTVDDGKYLILNSGDVLAKVRPAE